MLTRFYVSELPGIVTIIEANLLFTWCRDTFGFPSEYGEPGNHWYYGKEVDWTGRTMCSDPIDIEWYDFENPEHAIMFKLKWGGHGVQVKPY